MEATTQQLLDLGMELPLLLPYHVSEVLMAYTVNLDASRLS